jgi:coenzyme F420-reducing hydrogenase alpha subunit
MEIRVDHVTRVEGHGNILASIKNGEVQKAIFEVVEANRFFEAFMRERSHEEVAHIASRICGICALSHNSASVQATEKALGIEVSEQTALMRRLIMHAEMVSSHALHVYFLVAPDLLGLKSVVPLVEQDPDTVKLAFRVKTTAYDLAEVLVGRHTHPVAVVPGGYTSMPDATALAQMRERFIGLRADMRTTTELLKKLELPAFERETEYVSLQQPDHYSFYAGDIVSTDGGRVAADDYLDALSEFLVEHATARHCRWNRDSYMVGALARVNNNWRQLHPEAQKVMAELGFKPPVCNAFMNNIAQFIETVHAIEDAIALMDELLDRGIAEEEIPPITRHGRGVGVVEAPRGLLIHDYTYDERARLVEANCIIPTNQNYANLDRDLEAFAKQIADQPKDDVELKLEMLVRAYDPCISCSVH